MGETHTQGSGETQKEHYWEEGCSGLGDWFDMVVEGKIIEDDSQVFGLNNE